MSQTSKDAIEEPEFPIISFCNVVNLKTNAVFVSLNEFVILGSV